MKKILKRVFRKIRSAYYFALVRRKLHSYGSVTVNGPFHISSTAKVDVGHHVNINGMRISGMGGGKNWKPLPLWYWNQYYAWLA